MSKKIIKLVVNREFQLIGIVSNLSSYKISWLINSNINLDLKQTDDIIIKKNNQHYFFSNYTYDNEIGTIFNLISNKVENNILIKKLKNIDYFLQIEPNLSENKKNTLIENIKNIKNIISVLEISIKSLNPADYKIL